MENVMIDSAKSASGPGAASSGSGALSGPLSGASPRGERKEVPESLSSSFREAMREDGVKAGKHGGERATDAGGEAGGRRGVDEEPGLNGASPRGGRKEVPESPSSSFREAVREDGVKAGKHGGEHATDAGGEAGEEPGLNTPAALSATLSGDALLRGLGDNYAPLTGEAAEIGPDRPVLASELLERILVGKTEQAGETGEVRLTLKESVLPDTEIILRREGEKLIVTLVTDNAASYRILQQTRQDLHEKLLALQDDASVEVSFQDGSQEEGGQSGGEASPRRSRGLDYYG
jgi:type III secretion system needle length determinant